MTRAKVIFVDTSAWVEIILAGEKYHQKISGYFQTEVKNGSVFVTNDYVLDESWTRLVTHQSITSAVKLREKVLMACDQNYLKLLYTDKTAFDKGWKAFLKYSDHRLSFTDALIATLVEDLDLDEILTLDQGFAKIGLIVRPQL